MTTLPDMPRRSKMGAMLGDVQVRLSLLTAALVLVEAIVAKNVLHVSLDFFSQSVALWIFIAFMVSGERGRAAEFATGAIMITATAAVLVLYAV